MKQLRFYVPLFGILALIALFFKMPETPDIFGIFKCKTCIASEPYLPIIGSGYFAVLIALALLFPSFPGPLLARGGVIWATFLAATLTYIDFPNWCVPCLIAHFCNIMIWTIWWTVPSLAADSHASPLGERVFLTLLAPLIIIALFSSLNLTFMVYNLKTKHTMLATSLQAGDDIPNFTSLKDDYPFFANSDLSLINFVSPNCPFCTEQLSILSEIDQQLINISPQLTADLVKQSSSAAWIEDKEGILRDLFKVSGYPTLFVVGPQGKVVEVISGVSEGLKTLLTHKPNMSTPAPYIP